MDWCEADMFLWFLRDYKKEFIECGEDFGWETEDAEHFHKRMYAFAFKRWAKLLIEHSNEKHRK